MNVPMCNFAATELTAHLTEEEFADVALGLSTEAMDRHVESCEVCRAEVLALEGSIHAFAGAGRVWAEQQPAPSVRSLRVRVFLCSLRPVVGFAAAAIAVICIAAPIGRQQRAQAASIHSVVTREAQHATASVAAIVSTDSASATTNSQPVVALLSSVEPPTTAPVEDATQQQIDRDNAMMAAIDSEISAPVVLSADSVAGAVTQQ